MNKPTRILLAAFAAGIVQVASAVNYSPTDLLLVFREAGQNDVEFDLGSVSNYLGHAAGTHIPVSYDSFLVTTNFNNTLSGVRFAVVGASAVNDSSPRVWLSDANASSPGELTVNTYATLASKIGGVGASAKAQTSSSAGPFVVAPSDPNSYSLIVAPDDGSDLGISTMGGDSPVTVDAVNPATVALYELVPNAISPAPTAIKVGTFTMAPSGTITFTASKETPVITSMTVSNSATRGASSTFTVKADGATGFQWYRNGVAIVGQTSSTLTVANVKPGDAANYSVVVGNSNYVTTATSSSAPLTVTPAYVSGDLQLVFRESGSSNVEFNLGSVSNYLGQAAGTRPVSYNAALVKGNFNNTFSGVSFAVVAAAAVNDASPRVWLSDADLTSTPSELTVNTYSTLDSKVDGVGAAAGANTHRVNYNSPYVVASSDPNSYSSIVSPDDASDLGISTMGGDAPFTVEGVNPSSVAFYELTPSAGLPPLAKVVGAFTMHADGTITFSSGAIAITTQPADQVVPVTSNATFSVTAATVGTGGSALRYQWRTNGVNLAKATNSMVTVLAAKAMQNGWTYDVIVTNNFGAITSAPATLTVLAPLSITKQPLSQTNGVGRPVTFFVRVKGGAPAYQWRFNDTPISGATGSSYTIGAVTNTDAGNYSVVITNLVSTNTSAEAALTVTNDVELPVVKIVAPKDKASTNAPLIAIGSALDNCAVSNVLVSLNGSAFAAADISYSKYPSAVNWSFPLEVLPAGTNTFAAKAVDASGNVSATVTVHFQNRVPIPLTVQTNGDGVLVLDAKTAAGWSDNLNVGQNYKVSALADAMTGVVVPGPANLFSNWIVIANGSPILTNPMAKNFTFMMQSNLTLVVNFCTNRFIAAGGVYNGLYNDTVVAHQSAGLVSIKTTSARMFTGTLYVEGEGVPLSGAFDLSGHGTLTKPAVRKGLTNLLYDVQLDLDLNGGNNITGTVSNGVWASQLEAVKAIYDGTLSLTPHDVTNTAYTYILPGTNLAGAGPFGDGYGLVSVLPNGKVKVGGYLGDGEKVTPIVAPVSSNGVSLFNVYPFYMPLYPTSRVDVVPNDSLVQKAYNGSMIGWLVFTNGAVGPVLPTVGGNLFWNKTVWTNGYYDVGFTNDTVILGSSYTNSLGTNIISFTLGTDGVVTLAGGNLSGPISTNFEYVGAPPKILFEGKPSTLPNKIALLLNPLNGELSGSFSNNLVPQFITKIHGAVLQNGTNVARGNFKGVDQTGSVLLKAE